MTGGVENSRPFQNLPHGGDVQKPIGQQQSMEPGAQYIGSGPAGVGAERRVTRGTPVLRPQRTEAERLDNSVAGNGTLEHGRTRR